MFSNIYVNIKKFMKNYGFLLLTLVVFLILTFGKVPYDVNMPGGLIDLSDRVEVNGESVSVDGTFNMAYVSSVSGSIPHVLLSFVIPDWDVVPSTDAAYENETIEDARKRSKLYLEQSKDYATAVAMDAANIRYDITNRINYVAYITSEANTTLKVGDDIKSVNGTTINHADDIIALLKNLNIVVCNMNEIIIGVGNTLKKRFGGLRLFFGKTIS